MVRHHYSASFRVVDASHVGEVRRAAASLAHDAGFGEVERSNVALVVTEALTNLVKYAREGEVVLRALGRGGVPGVEILALDKGPGMSSVGECLRDGYSSGTSPGNGLGAMKRLSSTFELFSVPGAGTGVLARVWKGRTIPAVAAGGFDVGAVCLPIKGEEVPGDAWAVDVAPARTRIILADGLGHGVLAAEAAHAAVAVFESDKGRGPAALLEVAHGALRSTRGAAVAVAEIDTADRTIRFAGIGNISGVIAVPEKTRQMISHNGTVGMDIRKIQEFVYPMPAGARVIMHSDGLGTQWRLDRYLGLWPRDPSLVAGILYRDFTRGRDDVTVVVLREGANGVGLD